MTEKIETMTNEENRVLALIGKGHENAIPGKELACKLFTSERQVRNTIEDLRNKGFLILNNQDGKGYYLSENVEDIHRQYLQDNARAMSILKRMKYERRFLKQRGIELK